MRISAIIAFALALGMTKGVVAADLSHSHIVDLSHGYGEETIYWPNSPTRFEKTTLAYGQTDAGYFYSAYSFSTPEHGGTHIDAPMHFNENGWSVDKIPLERLIGHAYVIDITDKAAVETDYLLTVEDVAAFEAEHGPIPSGAIVFLRTGWSKRWPDTKAYLGDDTPGDTTNLHFPGYGEAAARLLVEERGVKVLGIDTASIDFGPSADFRVHRIAAPHNVANFENLMNLDQLPATGALIIALPMKIEGGSGGPLRVIAVLDDE